jgi:hypothetical protein
LVFWKRIVRTINKIRTTTSINSFKGEKTRVVVSLTLNPLLEIGATITRSCPPQIIVITDLITPNNPSVAIIGATPAIGPDEACLTNNLIKVNSTSAANKAPPIIATGSAIQNEPSLETAS